MIQRGTHLNRRKEIIGNCALLFCLLAIISSFEWFYLNAIGDMPPTRSYADRQVLELYGEAK